MLCDGVRRPLVYLCVTALVLGLFPASLLSQPSSVTGTVAGRVFDKDARTPISGVTVNAQLVTTDTLFTSGETEPLGSYLISDVPAGVYAFNLDYEGKEYPVEGRFDIRADMSFLLESCFVLDRASQTALLRSDCSSGLYAETQVVSLGPHRFFRPQPASTDTIESAQTGVTLSINHPGLQCIVRDYYPQLNANIQPQEEVQIGRVYFRAAQHSDFYYVDMQRTATGYQAILPRPAPDTTQVVYYIEGIDPDFDPTRTVEFYPEVTDHETCERRDPEAAYFTGDDPRIVIGSTVSGAASVPPGFLATGISSFVSASGTVASVAAGAAAGGAAGGLGTTGLVLIIAGVAGAATFIALEVTEEASPIR